MLTRCSRRRERAAPPSYDEMRLRRRAPTVRTMPTTSAVTPISTNDVVLFEPVNASACACCACAPARRHPDDRQAFGVGATGGVAAAVRP